MIKGYSKSSGYLPGEEFVDTTYRNSWNAVYVAGGWRLVQPNWGTMSVNNKVKERCLCHVILVSIGVHNLEYYYYKFPCYVHVSLIEKDPTGHNLLELRLLIAKQQIILIILLY